jgi:2-keto-4-pentenoate hydratase/2-oxohepta-3-ene-1,7-dioic acid hydratase in catechol pathway
MTITLPDGRAIRPGKLLCIGRNYAAHVREMGDVADLPAEPVVFLKPATALVASGGTVVLPRQSADVHHEVELVAVIGRAGKHVPEAEALSYVAAYALGLDLTARDLQAKAKAEKGPWSVAKGFDTFAPLGPLTPARRIPDPQALTIRLHVNGALRQEGTTDHMIFPVARLVAYLSGIFTLEPGDLLYTGTPEGVGPVRAGDRLEATGTGLEPLTVTAVAEGDERAVAEGDER